MHFTFNLKNKDGLRQDQNIYFLILSIYIIIKNNYEDTYMITRTFVYLFRVVTY